ncbi:MAG: hypothetical protein HW413_1218 [Thermoleophilia bacterium]|jgi:hypothetical protein|nr:hypothetical protein [Thermoleophilia bacterium]
MSRSPRPASASGGTPIWVWVVYFVGIFAAAIFVFFSLFSAGAYFLGDTPVGVSILGVIVWGGLMALAGGLWIWRRRQGRR